MAVITGTANGEALEGTPGDDTITALGGNDSVTGGDGNDTIDGGDGQDTLNGGDGSDTIDGGADYDQIDGGQGDDTLRGGDGDDAISDFFGANSFEGGLGDDFLQGEAAGRIMDGGEGNDFIAALLNSTDVIIFAGAGNDQIYALGANATVTLGSGVDTVAARFDRHIVVTDFQAGVGGDRLAVDYFLLFLQAYSGPNPFGTGHLRFVQDGANTLVQVDEDGTLNGQAFVTFMTLNNVTASAIVADQLGGYNPNGGSSPGVVLTGTAGEDRLDGGAGDDLIQGFAGADYLVGGDGLDQIEGGDQNDIIYGGFGSDVLDGGNQADHLYGEGGDDTLRGGDGNDVITDSNGNNSFEGGAGDDLLLGSAAGRVMDGGEGNDLIVADSLSSGVTIFAGAGNDEIIVEADTATITGGSGADSFSSSAAGLVTITDFQTGVGGDRFDIARLISQLINYSGTNPFGTGHLRFVQSGADTLFQIDTSGPSGGTAYETFMILNNVTASTITSEQIGGYNPDGSPVAGSTIVGNELGGPLPGGVGADNISGMGGDDVIEAGDGNDIVDGGDGDDDLHGSYGDDTLDGANHNDDIYGGAGNDILRGGAGDDYLFDIQGANSFEGGSGNDHIEGGALARVMDGGDGNDILIADDSSINATIFGGSGNDLITVTANGAMVTGGSGTDTFTASIFRSYTITDFQVGTTGDRLNIAGLLSQLAGFAGGNPFGTGHLRLVQSGSDTFVQADIDGTANGASWGTFLTLKNVSASAMTAINIGGFNPTGGPSAPIAFSRTLTVTEDVAVASLVDMLDADSNAFYAFLVDAPLHGDVNLLADGSFTYTPDSNYSGPDSFTFRASDSSLESELATVSITVNAVDDPPVAKDDQAFTTENAAAIGNLFLDSGAGADSDIDGGPKTVTAINGQPMVGLAFLLPSRATLQVEANGDFIYNPIGGLNYLISAAKAAATGAVNSGFLDTFTYTLAGGSQATVSVFVSGIDGPGDQLRDGPGNEVITGTAAGDVIVLLGGGSDSASGGNGNDFIFFGNTFSTDDSVNGGAGRDRFGLHGDYVLSFGANSFQGIERLMLYTSGDPMNGFDYNLTMHDGNVAAGTQLEIAALSLQPFETLIFNGSAETDGSFWVRAGAGNDQITGGQQGDRLVGGAGDDIISGAGGADRITGGEGADRMNGGSGADQFDVLQASQSTGPNFDTLVAFDPGADRINVSGTFAGWATAQVGSFSGSNFDGQLAALVDDALGEGQAIRVEMMGGNHAGLTLVVFDANGDGAYTAGLDYVFAFEMPLQANFESFSFFV